MTVLPGNLEKQFDEVLAAFRDEALELTVLDSLIYKVLALQRNVERLARATYVYRTERDLLRTVARNTVSEEAGSREPDEFVRHALDTLKEMPLVERACVVLFDAASGRPTVLYSFGLEGEEQSDLVEEISSGVVAQVRDSGEEVGSDEAWEDPEFEEMASVQKMKMQSLLCCPVPGGPGERPRGAIYIENRSCKGAFTGIYREAVRLLAAQMSQKMALLACAVDFDLDRTGSVRQRGRFAEFVGFSVATAQMLHEMDERLRAGLAGSPLLITGEPGAGKEILARCVHRYGARKEGPLQVVDAEKLSPRSALRTFVGAASGGSRKARAGLFRQADGGVLVIKNISRFPRNAQLALLHVLDTGRLPRVGDREGEPVDIWVVATSRGELAEAAEAGNFDRALSRRLHKRPIHVQPLRERPEDIPPLARHLAALEAGEERPAPFLATDLLAELYRRKWPGNAPELRAAMRALVEACPGPILMFSDLQAIDHHEALPDGGTAPLDWKEAEQHFRRSYLAWAVETWGPVPAEIAGALGVHRTYVYQLCNKLGVPLGKGRQRVEPG
jgi:DNA-binding NtrC family response regulator